jgi:hypothetical protein
MILGVSSFVAGAAVGSGVATLVAVLVVGLILSDFWRVRERLNQIRRFAMAQNHVWTTRRMTGQDWADLYDVIQPYEDA